MPWWAQMNTSPTHGNWACPRIPQRLVDEQRCVHLLKTIDLGVYIYIYVHIYIYTYFKDGLTISKLRLGYLRSAMIVRGLSQNIYSHGYGTPEWNRQMDVSQSTQLSGERCAAACVE